MPRAFLMAPACSRSASAVVMPARRTPRITDKVSWVSGMTRSEPDELGSRPRARGRARRPSFDHSSMAKPPA